MWRADIPPSRKQDIDVDFASDRRQEIKEYLESRYNKNGQQRVFSAGVFTTMKLKTAIKDVSRVYRVPLNQVSYLTSMLGEESTWKDFIAAGFKNPRIKEFIQTYPHVVEQVRNLIGQPRAASIHPSAIIVTPALKDGEKVDCYDFLPIRRMDGVLVSEFDGYEVEEIGLLKEDVLATKELSKLSGILSLVKKCYGSEISLSHIIRKELKDEKTYKLLSKGYTQGIFQFSSGGITRFIQDVEPKCIEDLIAINALYRPATLDIGATEDYIRYRRGEKVPLYNYGCYDATKNTFGIMVYQEQFMSVAHTLGGFDLGKTDFLRKAIGKKNADLMASLKIDFIEGACQNGCPEFEAEEIWHKIEVAGRYSFNRSHAAAYALTAYCGAWLKANYPLAFYTVALQFADDKEITQLLTEMPRTSNCKVSLPEINRSGLEFYTDFSTNEICWPLSRISFMGVKAVEYIISNRERLGKFKSFKDFITRIYMPSELRNPINSRLVKNMILAGCFDRLESFKMPQQRYGLILSAVNEFKMNYDKSEFAPDLIEEEYFWTQKQCEVSSVGSVDYQSIFMNSPYVEEFNRKGHYMNIPEILTPENLNKRVVVCAIVSDVIEKNYKDKTTGENKTFVKITLLQNGQLLECICWDDNYRVLKSILQKMKTKIAIISGKVQFDSFRGINRLNITKLSKIIVL